MLPPSDLTLALGAATAAALLGVDALYRSESGDASGLVVLNLDTEGKLRPDAFGSWGDAARRFTELRDAAVRLPEPDRRVYYDQLCHSTLAFIRWRSRGLGFEEQLGDFLHVPVAPASDAELDGLEASIGDALAGMGYEGSLAARCAEWERRTRVPADEVEDTLEGLLDEAWDRTEERLLEIPADKSDGMRVRTVSDVAYNARCDYLGRTVDVNVDPVLTRPGLRHLAVHEGCPGHYVQFKLRQTMFAQGMAPADVLLSVVNTASSSVFEGIADAGLNMIGWDDGEDDRVQSLLNRHRAGIGTGAAWRLHALGWPEERVADWLAGRSLVGGDGWVQNRMAFISGPSRAVLIWSYWWGEPSVLPVWRRVGAVHRQEFLQYLHGRMHSVRTVAMAPDRWEGEA